MAVSDFSSRCREVVRAMRAVEADFRIPAFTLLREADQVMGDEPDVDHLFDLALPQERTGGLPETASVLPFDPHSPKNPRQD